MKYKQLVNIGKKIHPYTTWLLNAIQEYVGDNLDEEIMMRYGFNVGKSLQHPMRNNPELLSDAVLTTTIVSRSCSLNGSCLILVSY